jgi:hypothetical protein
MVESQAEIAPATLPDVFQFFRGQGRRSDSLLAREEYWKGSAKAPNFGRHLPSQSHLLEQELVCLCLAFARKLCCEGVNGVHPPVGSRE